MFVAFLAGLLSFLSPCVLPVVPSYLSFVTGMSATSEMQSRRHLAVLHAALFVTGFTLIFIALGLTATAFGRLLNYYQRWLEMAGGVLIIVFGLFAMGALKSTWLMREARFQMADKPLGYLGSVLAGMAFGAGWTPCIGPILGSILLYISAAPDANLAKGIPLMLSYSLGLAIPFLVAAAALERFLLWSKAFRRYLAWVERIAGALLVVFGVLLISGQFSKLAQWLQALTPEFLRSRL